MAAGLWTNGVLYSYLLLSAAPGISPKGEHRDRWFFRPLEYDPERETCYSMVCLRAFVHLGNCGLWGEIYHEIPRTALSNHSHLGLDVFSTWICFFYPRTLGATSSRHALFCKGHKKHVALELLFF